jgi:hypothetical protein
MLCTIPKPPLASLDGAITNYYKRFVFFPKYYYFLRIYYRFSKRNSKGKGLLTVYLHIASA